MAGQDVPPVDVTLAAIREELQGLHLDLKPDAGIGIAAIPLEVDHALQVWTEQLESLATDHAALAAYAEAVTRVLADELPAIRDPLATVAAWNLTDLITNPLCDHLDLLDEDLEAIDETLGGIEECVCKLAGDSYWFGEELSNIALSLNDLAWAFISGEARCTVDAGTGWSSILDDLTDQLKEIKFPTAKELRGSSALIQRGSEPTIGEDLIDAQIRATDKLLADPNWEAGGLRGWLEDLVEFGQSAAGGVAETLAAAMEGRDQPGPGAAAGAAGGGQTGLAQVAKRLYDWLLPHAPMTPDKAPAAATAAYTRAYLFGLLAHAIAAIGRLQILGSGGLQLSGLARILGDLGGYGPVTSAVHGTLLDSYLRVPWRHYVNATARPYLPSIGDLQRFRYKRIFGGGRRSVKSPQPPASFQQCMAWWGYADEWIQIYENDLYREPMARDLLLMAEVADFDDEWWAYKVQRLGYDDTDAPLMVKAYQRRQARTQIMQAASTARSLRERGLISEDEYLSLMRETGLVERCGEYGLKAANWRLRRETIEATLDEIRYQYSRDFINDDELENAVTGLVVDPKLAKRIVLTEKVKRYGAVRKKRPWEEAREALKTYRAAFIAGLVDRATYYGALAACDLDEALVELRLELDSEARDAKIVTRWQRYHLPGLRDDLMAGRLTLDDYRAELEAGGFPHAYLDDELALAEALKDRHDTGLVQSVRLPAYERAYVLGLAARETVVQTLEDLGWDTETIQARLAVLDYERRREADRQAAEARRQANDQRADSARRGGKVLDFSDRAQALQNHLIAQQRAQEQADAAAEVLAQVEELEALDPTTTPDWRQRVAGLRAALDRAYLDRDADLPADLWDRALALEDAALRGPDYDLAALAEGLGELGDALASTAARSPQPAADRRAERERDQRRRGQDAARHAAAALREVLNQIQLRHPQWPDLALATLTQLSDAWRTRLVQIPADVRQQARALVLDLRGPEPPGPEEAGQALNDLARACDAYAQGWIDHPTVQPRPYA